MKKIARFLRKLADLFDPNVDPSDDLTIRVGVDASGAYKELEELTKRLKMGVERHF